jgi:tetraacyldisaccharide 4'-kinase
MLVITRADSLSAPDLALLKQDLRHRLHPDAPILVAEHRPTALRLLDGTECPASSLRGQPIAAACGIGNPDAFRRTLADLGADVRFFRTFDDHHAYSEADLRELLTVAEGVGVKMLVTTGKDSVKWAGLLGEKSVPPAVTVAAVEIALVMTEGEEVLRRRIADLLAPHGDR